MSDPFPAVIPSLPLPTELGIETFLERGLLLKVCERREEREGTVVVVVEKGELRGRPVAFLILSLCPAESKITSTEGKVIEIVERLQNVNLNV